MKDTHLDDTADEDGGNGDLKDVDFHEPPQHLRGLQEEVQLAPQEGAKDQKAFLALFDGGVVWWWVGYNCGVVVRWW